MKNEKKKRPKEIKISLNTICLRRIMFSRGVRNKMHERSMNQKMTLASDFSLIVMVALNARRAQLGRLDRVD